MRDRLKELLKQAQDKYSKLCFEYDRDSKGKTIESFEDFCADHLLANGVIVPPCKVGDYVLWNNGLKDSKPKMLEVKGFNYNPSDLGMRYILNSCQPIIDHSGIVGILTKEEAEAKLQERKED
jgi:hypothetical protein